MAARSAADHAPLANHAILRADEPELEAVELVWGQSHRAERSGVAVAITAEPMQHWSARGPIDQNLSLWAAFVVRTAAGGIYFAGDTGYGDGAHFREVGRQHGPLRLALLPIGGYEPRWFVGFAHMNPEEAVQAGLDLRADHVLGHHWATFRLTNEAIDEPKERFLAEVQVHTARRVSRVPARGIVVDRTREGARWRRPMTASRPSLLSFTVSRTEPRDHSLE